MIRSGRARRAGPAGLDVHERFARGRRWSLRAWRAAWAGALAAAVSVVVIWFGASVGVVVLVPAAFLVAVLVPVRGAGSWARVYLRRSQGLGYDTALEADGKDDPFGLWGESRERARLRVRGVTPPPMDWRWLTPTVVMVLLVAAVPLAVSDAAERSVAGGAGDASGGRDVTESGVGLEERDGPDDRAGSGAVDVAPEVQSRESVVGERAGSGDPRDGAGAEEAGGSESGRSDSVEDVATGSEAVRQFLESGEGLQGEESSEELGDAGGRVGEGVEGGEDRVTAPAARDGRGEGGVNGDASGARPDAGRAGVNDGVLEDGADSGGREAVDAGALEATSEGSGDASGGSRDGSEQAEGPGAAEDARPGRLDDGVDGVDGSMEGVVDRAAFEEASSGSSGGEEGTPDGVSAGEAARAAEASRPARDATAGVAPGEDVPVAPVGGRPEGPVERLDGERGEGPSVTIGTTRDAGARPDDAPAVTVGPGIDGRLARDVERATEESNLPAAYREIVRRYFR